MYRFLRRFLASRQRYKILLVCGLLLATMAGYPSPSASLPTASSTQRVQSGVSAYNAGQYQAAIADWKTALEQYAPTALNERAVVNENLARAYRQIGETAQSLDYWELAANDYEARGNFVQFGRMLSEQAQVYISRGQHQRAVALLCDQAPVINTAEQTSSTVTCEGGAYEIALDHNDVIGQAASLGNLAEAQRLRGFHSEAQQLLSIGLDLVDNNNLNGYKAAMLNSLGSVHTQLSRIATRRIESANLFDLTQERMTSQADAIAQTTAAVTAFEQAAAIANQQNDDFSELRAQLNILLLNRQRQHTENQQIVEPFSNQQPILQNASGRERVATLIDQLPATRETAYAAITLANSYSTPQQDFSCVSYQAAAPQQTWLKKARQIAVSIQDARAESFAIGELGHIAECQRQLETAARLTQQAQLAAGDALESSDSLYLWEWQMGRIHHMQGNVEQAKADYAQAIVTLETIRSDILTADRDLQFDFRDTVEPIYRQYITLQLQNFPNTSASKQIQTLPDNNITETLKTIDALRLAELQNFFGNDCVLVSAQGARDRLLTNDPFTTVISSVVLSDSVVLIANLPDDTTEVVYIRDVDSLRETASLFRSGLKRYTDRVYDRAPAVALYQQLIKPLQASLERTDTQTLVFVQDGFLRNIPMSALNDGDRYLIESYAVATTPSLNLTDTSASTRTNPRALAVGLSQQAVIENGRDFPALRSVPSELASISDQIPGSKVLIDDDFTTDKLAIALQENSYSILHLATHGQFSTLPEETFIITGSEESGVAGKLTFGELEDLIQQASSNAEPIDLITLTACETAKGDDRATLGLAGVAIRAGARSAIASLWKLDDNTSAELIAEFYRNLPDIQLSKAQALQQAQIGAITKNRNANPGSWAPLILVGNWQ